MGIRFQCPNGHPLNVKSYLAGRRGICPECNARFLVPLTDEKPTTPDLAQTKTAPIEMASEKPIVTASPPPQITTPEDLDSTSLWYVRNDTNQQYGPVKTAVIQQWLTEGRIASASWVWRTGWSQWKQADEVFATTVPPPPLPKADDFSIDTAPAMTPPATLNPITPPTPQSLPLAEASRPDSPSITHRKRIDRRKKRRTQLTLLLALMVAMLFLGLLIVVLR